MRGPRGQFFAELAVRACIALGLLLAGAAIVLAMLGYGRPAHLPDGTATLTSTGIALMAMLFGGASLAILADNPWRFLQLAMIAAGAGLGIYLASTDPDPSVRRGAQIVGTAIGIGIAYLLTLALSRLMDWWRKPRRDA